MELYDQSIPTIINLYSSIKSIQDHEDILRHKDSMGPGHFAEEFKTVRFATHRGAGTTASIVHLINMLGADRCLLIVPSRKEKDFIMRRHNNIEYDVMSTPGQLHWAMRSRINETPPSDRPMVELIVVDGYSRLERNQRELINEVRCDFAEHYNIWMNMG